MRQRSQHTPADPLDPRPAAGRLLARVRWRGERPTPLQLWAAAKWLQGYVMHRYTCPVCGREGWAVTRRRRYCSSACRSRAWRERQKGPAAQAVGRMERALRRHEAQAGQG